MQVMKKEEKVYMKGVRDKTFIRQQVNNLKFSKKSKNVLQGRREGRWSFLYSNTHGTMK